MTRRVLVGCGKSKADEPREALYLYKSTYAKKKREYAETFGDDIKIVSAEHHLVDADAVLDPYETSLHSFSQPERDQWARTVKDQLRSLDWDEVDVVDVLVSGPYLEALRNVGVFEQIPVAARTPLEEYSGIGYQMQYLGNVVEEAAQH